VQKEYVLAGAIVIGSGLIALGLYAGLSASGPGPSGTAPPALAPPPSSALLPPPLPATGVPPAAVEVSAAPSAGGVSATSSVRPPGSVEAVKQEVVKLLAEQKKALFVPKCWQPALAKQAEPKTSRFLFSLSFDAAGVERVRGISEIRGESRVDVARCLREQPGGLKITPTGASVSLELFLDFP
jgi:hypothetical protein